MSIDKMKELNKALSEYLTVISQSVVYEYGKYFDQNIDRVIDEIKRRTQEIKEYYSRGITKPSST